MTFCTATAQHHSPPRLEPLDEGRRSCSKSIRSVILGQAAETLRSSLPLETASRTCRADDGCVSDIRDLLGFHDPYVSFCREERNYAALLYHVLLLPGNLQRFLEHLQEEGVVSDTWPKDTETAELYMEYAILRDMWKRVRPDPDTAVHTIAALVPGFPLEHLSDDPAKFNGLLVSGSNPSSKHVQNPGRWSIAKINSLYGPDETEVFRLTCMFKWSFNIKPDLALQLSPDHVIVLETKYESAAAKYPTKPEEQAIFNARRCERVGQMELQDFLLRNILGMQTAHLLVRKNPLSPPVTPDSQAPYVTTTWKSILGSLDLGQAHSFARAMIDTRLLNQTP